MEVFNEFLVAGAEGVEVDLEGVREIDEEVGCFLKTTDDVKSGCDDYFGGTTLGEVFGLGDLTVFFLGESVETHGGVDVLGGDVKERGKMVHLFTDFSEASFAGVFCVAHD